MPLASGIGTGAWPWVSAARDWWGTSLTDVGFLASAPLLLGAERQLGPAETEAPQHA